MTNIAWSLALKCTKQKKPAIKYEGQKHSLEENKVFADEPNTTEWFLRDSLVDWTECSYCLLCVESIYYKFATEIFSFSLYLKCCKSQHIQKGCKSLIKRQFILSILFSLKEQIKLKSWFAALAITELEPSFFSDTHSSCRMNTVQITWQISLKDNIRITCSLLLIYV